MNSRETRRQLGVLCKRLPEAKLGTLTDPRRRQGRRWSLRALLRAVLIGLVAGAKSLKDVESLSDDMSHATRKLMALRGRVPDTTLRNVLVRLMPDELRRCLHHQVRKAHRRKALAPTDLPFGIVALDGRSTTLKVKKGSPLVQFRKSADGVRQAYLRTVTATLTSSSQKLCIDTTSIPRGANEQSHYTHALDQLIENYGALQLFEMVSYDAGACSRLNARYTREAGLHYLMRINNQPRLQAEAVRRIGEIEEDNCLAETVDREHGCTVVRRLSLVDDVETWKPWTGAKTLIARRRIVIKPNGEVESDQIRYYVSSLPSADLTSDQWLRVVRDHWAVENNCHHTFDAVLREDERPWIVADAQGALVLLMLRRLAYNILTLHRCNYAAPAKRLPEWRHLQRRFYVALLTAAAEHVMGLRPVAAPARPT